MAELLSDASSLEAQAVEASVVEVDEVVSAHGDQPVPAAEDLPVDASPNEVVGAVVDAHLEVGTGVPAPGADEVAAAPVAEAAPRRRRRATSRPAGPPAT
jgi:hypothetical protein